ncbi:hypothetical protein E1286_05225 [Nonomuraea terrae]|uniref:NlpC/P60 domain-containing protein n=1 Tax=Nonomuraea terrae TaxID=2530383 RepID=A0A4R4ZDZ3_9ACTN|nr:NlpC/P60 family protein [Nonomuraea terrae]TDD54592.1 hypothetical protein E1286_05225 [Nonomuraea terrae]
MAEFQAGEVVVPVVPSAQSFIKDLQKQVLKGAYPLGQEIGKEIQRGISDQLKGVYEPLKEETRKQRQQAPKDGDQIGGSFAQAFRRRLEAGLKALPKAELDADATAADQQVQALRARLATLADQTIGIDIDAGAAETELAAIQRELAAIDGDAVTIDVRTDIATALAELAAVESGMNRVGGIVARPRVDVDISGALASIGTISAALAGLAAIPVAATVGAGVASLAAPLAAAGIGFAGLAAVAVPSVSRIGEALQQQEQAQKAATTATAGAAGAAQQAQIQALNLAAAEDRVADAKRDAKTAEDDLTRARQEAKRAAEDLARAVANAALDEESAALAVEEARQRLAEVQADPKAGELERKRAELDVRQAEQRAKDTQARNKQLQQDQKTADKAGIEGSDQVVAAKKRIEDANNRVEDAERQLRLMQLQQAAAAQQSAAANRQVAGEVIKLSPAAQKLAKQWKSFSDVYETWQKKLEPDVLPALGSGLQFVEKLLPKLSPLVKGVSGALDGLIDSATKALGGKFWTDFFAMLSREAPGIVTGLGKSFGNVITGVAGIVKAFLPFSGTVVGGIESATKAFSDWGKSLGESQGFKDFIAYVQENAPKVIEVVSNIATTIGNLLSGLSGPGAGALDVIVSISETLASLTPGQLQAIALAAAGVFAAFKAWQAITGIVNGVRSAIQTASSIVGGARAVWSGLGSAAKGAAGVARTAGSGIATAARTAGSVASKGATAAWTGIQTAASRAGAAARTAGTVIASAARTAGTAAVALLRVAAGYTRIAAQALLARTRILLATAAQVAVRAATAAWTAIQWALNAALNANPIGLIVIAIAALVAGLIYAYQNSETFRNIVDAAFKAIGEAATWVWETVLKPVFDALVALWQNVIAPAATWLWQTIIKPAFDGIGAAVQWAWTNLIQPAVQALVAFWQSTLGPVFTWLWNNIVKPAWDGIGKGIKIAWETIIKPAVAALVAFWRETLAPVFTWLWNTIIKPAWDGISGAIKTAWEKVIQPAVQAFWKFISETLPDGFKKGVDMIGRFWDGLKEIAKKPVNFIIETVYNNGIVSLWNTVADALGLDAKLSKIPALATGGVVPGYTPGRDTMIAAVGGGEAVMRPEWTRAVGTDFVSQANAAARKGGISGAASFMQQRFMGAYAGGGIIGDVLAQGVRWGAEKLLNPILDSAASAMGSGQWAKMLVSWPRKMVDDVITFLEGKEAAAGGPGAQKALEFARQQLGKPYQWGGAGPSSFDCSGLTMRAWQAGGRSDIPRTSQQQMGWVQQVAKPVPGALGFPHPGHVWMYVNPNTIIEAPQTGLNVRQVSARAAQMVGVPPSKDAATYDNGGYLPTGHSLVYNGTGQPEPVLTDRQWQAMQGGTRGGDGALIRIDEFNATPQQDPYAIAKDLNFILGRRRR